MESKKLQANAFGDSPVKEVKFYLPPNYTEEKTYPVMYMLTGWSARGGYYLNESFSFVPTLQNQFDEAIEKNEMPPFVAVFPDCTFSLGCSQYINSPTAGPFMDFLCDELVPWVESKYSVSKNREERSVLGHSSGGYGALVTGMLRSDVFANVCSSAGDSWFEYLYVKMIPQIIGAIEKEGSIEKLFAKFFASPNPTGLLSRSLGEAIMMLNMCTCYAPNINVPLFKGDLYFDQKTGKIIPEVWKRILSWDPINMVEQNIDSLQSLRCIHLEAGSEDEYGLHLGHRQLAEKLKLHSISYHQEEYPGKHSGHHHRFKDRIKKILHA